MKISIFEKIKVMNRILFTLIICFFQIEFVAQSLSVTGSNSIMYNSTTVSGLDTLDPCLQTYSYLTVKNISNKSHNILCEKKIISQTDGAENYFCWGGTCYGVGTMISTESLTLQSGEDNDISFGGYFDAYCEDAQAIVKYCFYPDADTLDQTCIYITYHGAATSIKENLSATISNFYPNPASEKINFYYSSNESAELKITDILGEQVLHVDLNFPGKIQLDVSDFSSGIYFANLIVEKNIKSTKKIIIK